MARKRPQPSTTVTTQPEMPAPTMRCPGCGRTLGYIKTFFCGVTPIERYDYYECSQCGQFQYRHRSGRLRPAPKI
jgi:hypothetical protein